MRRTAFQVHDRGFDKAASTPILSWPEIWQKWPLHLTTVVPHRGYGDGILQQTFSIEPDVFAYWFVQGTSMAAPHVSGAAALLISNGVTDPDKVRQAIEKTAKDIGPGGWDEEYGWGLINVAAALSYTLRGDLSGDLLVSFEDLSLVADQWLWQAALSPVADFSGDGVVNFVDFAILAQECSK